MEYLPASSIAHSMEVSSLVRPQFFNLHQWLEPTYLPYAGYDHILSKQIGPPHVTQKCLTRQASN